MEYSKRIIEELSNLPNYKDNFTESLAEFGVTSIEDLRQVLSDTERTSSMISAVKGLGPRTVQLWEKALSSTEEASENISEEQPEAPEETQENVEPMEEEAAIPATEEETPHDEVVEGPGIHRPERNLSCTMADLKEIQQTTVDLLQMNGSKKKGRMASVEYAVKKLTGAGMEVTISKEGGAPVVVANKGEGGIVLWGHLDTERLAGMKRKKQGNIQGDMVNGRGAANMKGAVATMICVSNRLVSWQVPFSIVLTTDSLGEQKGAESLADDSLIRRSKGILMLAPTSMRSVVGQYGYAAILVTTYGDGAVMKMASFLKGLTNEIESSPERLSVKTGLIRGGKKRMPYAPALSCGVVLEIETRETTDFAISIIEGILDQTEHNVEILCRSEMAEFDRTNDLVASVTELTKTEPVFEMIHSEAGKIVSANPKIVLCGPGNIANSQSDQEYVTLNDLEKTFETILTLIDGAEPLEGA
ncbi:MAG TPA: M20/M25/M40 family metallo-hydrolase [Methanomassiliicoccales archaeon]|jgi:acetylornithine deacetylase/succinyl-diaminopimelate desuccinylase-like protein